jgi:hypothetical protein
MSVKAISDTSTFHPGTLGETPSSVSISPNTIHGWRPISVKTQPTRMPSSASGACQIAIFHIQGATGRVALRRVTHRPTTATRAARPPKPIIQRNDQ